MELLLTEGKKDFEVTQNQLAIGRTATLTKLTSFAAAKVSSALVAFMLIAMVVINLPNNEIGLFLLTFTILTILIVVYLGVDGLSLRFFDFHILDVYRQHELNGITLFFIALSPSVTLLSLTFSQIIVNKIFIKLGFFLGEFWIFPVMIVFYLLLSGCQCLYKLIWFAIFKNLWMSALFIVEVVYILNECTGPLCRYDYGL